MFAEAAEGRASALVLEKKNRKPSSSLLRSEAWKRQQVPLTACGHFCACEHCFHGTEEVASAATRTQDERRVVRRREFALI